MFKFEVGVQAKDKLTGYKGLITGRCDYITGCNQYLLQPKGKNNAEYPKSTWFDENRIEVLKSKKIKLETGTSIKDNGACESAPTK